MDKFRKQTIPFPENTIKKKITFMLSVHDFFLLNLQNKREKNHRINFNLDFLARIKSAIQNIFLSLQLVKFMRKKITKWFDRLHKITKSAHVII